MPRDVTGRVAAHSGCQGTAAGGARVNTTCIYVRLWAVAAACLGWTHKQRGRARPISCALPCGLRRRSPAASRLLVLGTSARKENDGSAQSFSIPGHTTRTRRTTPAAFTLGPLSPLISRPTPFTSPHTPFHPIRPHYAPPTRPSDAPPPPPPTLLRSPPHHAFPPPHYPQP